MSDAKWSRTISILCTCLMLSLSALADAQVRFDLPAEALSQALTSVGSLTNVNVLFDPSLVDGLQSPPLNAELSADDAFTRLLEGTRLRVVRVDANTVRVVAENRKTGLKSTAVYETGAIYLPVSTGFVYARANGSSPTQAFESQTTTSDENAQDRTSSRNESVDEVVVTGTHIRGVSPTSPVIAIDSTDIARSGYTNIGDVIRSLPQNFGGGNSPQVEVGNGASTTSQDSYSPSGGSAPNLRGLGSSSTLTLVDGRRLAEDNGYGAVDISSIPVIAVDRIEILTDGASAVYGSDAVAGVVNFILKKPFDGAETVLSGGRATAGGAFDRRFDQLFGKTWNGGGAILTYEHDKQDAVDASQREFTRSAPDPYFLLPEGTRDSIFVSSTQEITSLVSMFAEGLYTKRSSDTVATYDPSIPSFSDPAWVKQYLATLGLRAALPGDWMATLFGSTSEQRTVRDILQFTPGIPGSTPAVPEENLIGISRSLELDADGALFVGPGGPIRMAIGAGYRREAFHDYFPDGSESFASGARQIDYAFGELSVPCVTPADRVGLRRLEFLAGGRFEHYSDFGGEAVPKVGILYVPIQPLSVHASWGKSFRAPTLSDLSAPKVLTLDQLTDPLSATGTSNVLEISGGNATLKPETAHSTTFGFEYVPQWLVGAQLTATYYDIRYDNRIGSLPSSFQALTYAGFAPFVMRNPSLALQQQLLDQVGGNLINRTATPYDPTSIAAVVSNLPINVSSQRIKGLDLGMRYRLQRGIQTTDMFVSGSYLNFRQRLTSLTPEQSLSGTVFDPPRFKVRSGATWTAGPWSATGTLNFLGRETNQFSVDYHDVASWTTVDARVAFTPRGAGWLAGTQVSISVQNLLDRAPPTVRDVLVPGLNYDSSNASPVGRYVNLSLSKAWH